MRDGLSANKIFNPINHGFPNTFMQNGLFNLIRFHYAPGIRSHAPTPHVGAENSGDADFHPAKPWYMPWYCGNIIEITQAQALQVVRLTLLWQHPLA